MNAAIFTYNVSSQLVNTEKKPMGPGALFCTYTIAYHSMKGCATRGSGSLPEMVLLSVFGHALREIINIKDVKA